MSSFIAAHSANPDWRIALDQCLSDLGRRASAELAGYTLGWCYLTDEFADSAEALLAELQQRLPGANWVGTVGIGVCAEGIEYIGEPAVVLMLAPLSRDAFRVFSGRQPLRAGAPDFEAYAALVHADGSAPDLQELLPELAERTATGYLFGGLSSSRTHTLQIADAVLTGGLSGVAFSDKVGVLSRVSQGCQPIGPLREVTKAQDNHVIELDGRPALSCALEDLGLSAALPAEQMAEALSSTLAGLCRGSDDAVATPGCFGADTLVRHIVGLDPRAGVLAIGDALEAGDRLSFCRRDPDAALHDLRRIAAEIRDQLAASGQHADGAIYVTCIGRGGAHFGAPNAELVAIGDVLGELPLAGFFAGGEIARDRLYGYTGVLTVFATPA